MSRCSYGYDCEGMPEYGVILIQEDGEEGYQWLSCGDFEDLGQAIASALAHFPNARGVLVHELRGEQDG